MIYMWRCASCDTITEVQRRIADIEQPPDACSCGVAAFTRREIVRDNPKVKGFRLLGDKHWHDCEYTKYRSIK